jgi:hypothetical protein
VSRAEPRPDVQDRPSLRGHPKGDAEIANDLMRALGQIGNAAAFSPPSSEVASAPEVKQLGEPAAIVAEPGLQRPRFGGRIGTIATAYVAFIVLIGVGTYFLMASGMHQYKPPSPAVLAAAAPLTEGADDQRPRAENGGTGSDRQSPSPAQPPAPDAGAAKPLLPLIAAELPPTQSTAPASQPAENAVAVSAVETRTAQAEAPQPAASATRQDTDGFVAQGRALLASGDIISARHFFEYAAKRGDPAAARQVGETYDPVVLRQAAARGIAGNGDKAAYWYLQAMEHGDAAAAERLKRLLGR